MVDSANTTADTKGHSLLCPVCRVDLVMTERQGIEIDYCPKCRGVWLDRGELDKIIERSARAETQDAQTQPYAPQQEPPSPSQGYYDSGHGSGHGGHGSGHGGHGGGHGQSRGHGSFLGRLFD